MLSLQCRGLPLSSGYYISSALIEVKQCSCVFIPRHLVEHVLPGPLRPRTEASARVAAVHLPPMLFPCPVQQRLADAEGILQHPVEMHGHAVATDAELTGALERCRTRAPSSPLSAARTPLVF